MKQDSTKIIAYLHRKLGKEELWNFLFLFGGVRWTVPERRHYHDAARDAEVIEAFRTKPPCTVTEFYRQQAREQGCSPRTIERILARQFKKSA